MELLLVLLLVLVVLAIVLPVAALVRAGAARRGNEETNQRVRELTQRMVSLESQLQTLRKSVQSDREPAPPPAPAQIPETAAPVVSATLVQKRPPVDAPPGAPPLLLASPRPLAPPPVPLPTASVAEPAAAPQFNWEQFFGVKLFAWAAGLAIFLGVAFALKLSFERGLITPPVRVAMGFVTGLGLLIGGLRIPRERYAVTVHALTAAGILVLYADIFAACSYHFIGHAAAFALMSVVTAVAFLLAVRLNAPTVAVLGLLGGFLTPPLLSTGVDQPLALFGYLALLDVGLLAVALRQRWNYLTLLSAIATMLMQFGWVAQFFTEFKVLTGMAVFLSFAGLYTGAMFVAHRRQQVDPLFSAGALLPSAAAVLFGAYLLFRPYPTMVASPWWLFGFLFLADGAALAMAAVRKELRPVHGLAGGVMFLLLSYWTANFLTADLLKEALGLFLLFAGGHSAFPIVMERVAPANQPGWWAHCFPPLALVLTMFPIFKLTELSLLIWPAILLLDVMAILLAVLTASVLAILVVLLLTGAATVFWIEKIPAELTRLPETLFIVGGFAVLFFFISLWVWRKMTAEGSKNGRWTLPAGLASVNLPPEVVRAAVPALSALLPFLLLTLMVLRLPLDNPSPVFGLAVLLVVLLLGLVRFIGADWVALAALGGLTLLEYTWHFQHFDPELAVTPLVWYAGFYALFAIFPFVFQARLQTRLAPWLAAALAGPAQFFLVYRLVDAAYPNPVMGLVPAVFAVPSLLSLVRVLRTVPAEVARRNTQLALFGGVALFFLTLIFPIQFEKQWLTVGWALEGTALLWLFHRVPHNGLKYVGTALLAAVFARLAFNPEVMSYHPRSATPIVNWYLYTYGIATLCLFVSARLLAPPRHRIQELNVPPILAGLGTVLAFLLMNIEIADAFSTGPTVTFRFSDNFARDMTYSLAWGGFAFVVLFVGIRKEIRWARYAGIGLLVVTLVKLFLHDLWRLGGWYRIGALIGLALVLIPVSLLYQRYLAGSAARKPPSVNDP